MMAGVERNGVEQSRIDKVQIIHAGEDVKVTIQPLAVILEEQLKLGEQVDYRRHFRNETSTLVANHIVDSISNGSEDKGVVLVHGEKFNNVFSTNSAALNSIKNTLSEKRLKIALVTTGGSCVSFPKPSINLGSYAAKMDDGALAEAIYKQWFGPQARLISQAEVSKNGLVNSDTAQDDYAPCKVKIIHAMQDPATKMHKRHLSDAVDEIVDPEETTSSRIKFMSDQSIARTVLGDLECFLCCSRKPKVHAVFVWCKDMLNALKQDKEAKNKVVDIVCRDTSQQKLFAHFLIGVTRQEISTFSQALLEFLIKQGQIVILESFSCQSPVNYKPFAHTFLRIWAGSIKVPKDPEESLDPTMTSLDSSECSPTSQKPEAGLQQSHPHQNNAGDRLVMNNGSVSQSDAVRTRQMGKGLGDFNPSYTSQEKVVISDKSWDTRLMNCTQKAQPDGHSNPPRKWSHRHTGHGLNFTEDPSLANLEAVPVRQPTNNFDGKNKMAICSNVSVTMHAPVGPKTTDMKMPPTSSEPPDRYARSLPPNGGQQRLLQQKGQQPSSRVPGEHCGKNKVAASGFASWSVHGGSTRSDSSLSQSGVDQQAAAGTGLRDLGLRASSSLGQGDNLSVGDNPVRIVSDSDVLTSEDAHQLDDALLTLRSATSLHTTPSVVSGLQSLTISDTAGSASAVTSEQTGMSLDVNSWICRQSDGSQSVPYRQPESSDRVMSAPEGRNPMLEGNTSTCGSVSLPFPGANRNAGQNSLPSANGTTSVHSQTGVGPLRNVDQQTKEDTLLSDIGQVLIRGLKIRLDPPKQTVADWQDLASDFGVDNVHITYWKGQKSDSSPFEQLLTWLKAEKQHLTVKDLKVKLEKVKRFDVLRFLESQGF